MTTIKDMVADTRRMAYGSLNEQINLLTTDVPAGASVLPMDIDVSGITPGMILSADLNVWYVRATDASSNSVYVIPGYDNSPSVPVSASTMVYIKPRVTDWYLFNMLNREITRLSSPDNGLYHINSWTTQVDPTYQTYNLPTADFGPFLGMIRVRYRMPGTTDVWIDLPDRTYTVQIDDAGCIIRVKRNIPSGTDIEFVFKSGFTAATSLADDPVADCGLTETMVDIPALGCLAYLLRTTESRRTQPMMQGDARRAAEVPVTANSDIARAVERDYQARVNEEYVRLIGRNPYVRSV